MTKTDTPDPWVYKLSASLDDGGGAGFASGYDT